MANSSSVLGAIVYSLLICVLVLGVALRPSLLFEQADALADEPPQDSTREMPIMFAEVVATSTLPTPAPLIEREIVREETLVVAAPLPAPAPVVRNIEERPTEPIAAAIENPQPVATAAAASVIPTRISIPSVAIDSGVVGVGVNAAGEIEVPSGETQHVGWYAPGARPGARGVAVMDAHVYAAFENLSATQVGADIYVADASGAQLHFKVTKVATYALANLTPLMLFTGVGTSGKYLNLITCAGEYHASAGTYDHRLIVFAELVE